MKSKRIKAYSEIETYENLTSFINLEPIKKLIKIVRNLPGFKIEFIIKQVPRLILEPDSRKMGIKVAQRVAEKSVIRLVKVAAGPSK